MTKALPAHPESSAVESRDLRSELAPASIAKNSRIRLIIQILQGLGAFYAIGVLTTPLPFMDRLDFRITQEFNALYSILVLVSMAYLHWISRWFLSPMSRLSPFGQGRLLARIHDKYPARFWSPSLFFGLGYAGIGLGLLMFAMPQVTDPLILEDRAIRYADPEVFGTMVLSPMVNVMVGVLWQTRREFFAYLELLE